jgi:hypothetical protein
LKRAIICPAVSSSWPMEVTSTNFSTPDTTPVPQVAPSPPGAGRITSTSPPGLVTTGLERPRLRT